MNRLEEALTDTSNGQLDFYLENEPLAVIRADIEEIIKKSICSTPQGQLREKILKVLQEA